MIKSMCTAGILAVAFGVAAVNIVSAQTGDFTFKRVGVPTGSEPRITVQIAPANPEPAAAPAATQSTTPATDGASQARYPWYWTIVSPDISAQSPGRLESAVLALDKGAPSVSAPRLQDLQNIAQVHGRSILLATVGTDISPAFVLAVISVESGGRADIVSSAGAVGLMQLMPGTAERFGTTDRTDPIDNLKGGVAFLEMLAGIFDKDPVLMLAGYNAGENAVTRAGGVPNYAETRDYVPKVLAAWAVAKGLCLTPPQLITDGCVFRVSQ
ncbi:MAG: lytic transglycosylase domain-containing protein [Pseudomonadota bacterium]